MKIFDNFDFDKCTDTLMFFFKRTLYRYQYLPVLVLKSLTLYFTSTIHHKYLVIFTDIYIFTNI